MAERRSRVRYDEDTAPDPVNEEHSYSRWRRRDRDWIEHRDRRDGREARSWRSTPYERQDSWRRRREQSPVRSRDARPPEPKRSLSPVQQDTPSVQDADADQMAAIMGFGHFGSSKVRKHTRNAYLQGKPVEDNSEGYAHIRKEHSWRQYMNRYVQPSLTTSKGGFNRPLDKV